jgi:putative transcriptional regulator
VTVARHPSDELMLARATGALDAATALALDTHAALCPACRAEMQALDAVGGALVADIAPVAMSSGAFEALMARIDAEPAPASAETEEVARLPAPLRPVVAEALAIGRWRPLAPGIRGLDLPVGRSAPAGAVQLMRLEPGRGVPRHGHAGHELTLVLEGAFRDEAGRYEAGDFILCGPSDTHRPVAEPGRVCLALAVTDAPLKLAGVLGLIQRAFLQTRT